MQRKLQGHYSTVSTVGEKVQAFAPSGLPPEPANAWTPGLRDKTGSTAATVNKYLGNLQCLGIVRELTARKRNRLFSYHRQLVQLPPILRNHEQEGRTARELIFASGLAFTLATMGRIIHSEREKSNVKPDHVFLPLECSCTKFGT